MPTPSFFAETAQIIENSGHSIVWVGCRDEPFMYTIGNSLCGLAELFVFGPQSLGWVVNELCERQRERGAPFDHGQTIMIDTGRGTYPVMIAEVDQAELRDKYSIQAGQFLKNEVYHVQQIITTDMKRLYPYQAGYRGIPQKLFNVAPLPV